LMLLATSQNTPLLLEHFPFAEDLGIITDLNYKLEELMKELDGYLNAKDSNKDIVRKLRKEKDIMEMVFLLRKENYTSSKKGFRCYFKKSLVFHFLKTWFLKRHAKNLETTTSHPINV